MVHGFSGKDRAWRCLSQDAGSFLSVLIDLYEGVSAHSNGITHRRIQTGFLLILHLDAGLIGIIVLSLKISGLALIIATAMGLPLGALLDLKSFPAKGRSSVS